MELQPIQSKIYEIRGQRVMLDFDLAELYQVETKRLKEAVRRNIERFEGDDFMFVLSKKEYEILRTIRSCIDIDDDVSIDIRLFLASTCSIFLMSLTKRWYSHLRSHSVKANRCIIILLCMFRQRKR